MPRKGNKKIRIRGSRGCGRDACGCFQLSGVHTPHREVGFEQGLEGNELVNWGKVVPGLNKSLSRGGTGRYMLHHVL